MGGERTGLFDEDDEGEIAPPGGVAGAPLVPQPARRGGRRPGATNLKTRTLGKYLQAKGFRDPAVALAELANSDPVELWQWIRGHNPGGETSLIDVIKLQADAAKSLLPYLHGKVTPDVLVDASSLPAFHLHLGGSAPGDGVARGLSLADFIGKAPSNEINGLAVRRDEATDAETTEDG